MPAAYLVHAPTFTDSGSFAYYPKTEDEIRTMTDPRSPASPTVPAIFNRLASRGQVPSLRRTSGIFEFSLDDGGHWFLALDHGTPSVVAKAEESTCNVRCHASDFVAIAEGKSDMVTAYLRGDLACTGNLSFALTFRHLVPVVA